MKRNLFCLRLLLCVAVTVICSGSMVAMGFSDHTQGGIFVLRDGDRILETTYLGEANDDEEPIDYESLAFVAYNAETGEVTRTPYVPSEEPIVNLPSGSVNIDLLNNSDEPSPRLKFDNRIQIRSPQTYPYCAVVRIKAYFAKGTLEGSGALVGDKVVLTAGHVVYDEDMGGWATKAEIIPAGSETTYTSVRNGFESCAGWVEKGDFDYDYAVIDLASSPNVGYFGTKNMSTTNLKNNRFYVYGFPGDKPEGTLWETMGSTYLVDTRRFIFHGYSTDGFSGGPVVCDSDLGNIVGVLSGNVREDVEHYCVAVRVNDAINKLAANHRNK